MQSADPDSDKKDKPRSIGRYVLFQEVAHGGMATVHIGRLRGPAGFARTVAIKRLHPPFARDPEFVSMFLDEARLAARIQHPNVVSVLDCVTAEGELFLVMDYIHGESLSQLFKLAARAKVPMSRRVLTTIMVGVLGGLDAAHEARNEKGEALEIVHRDVSPQNVLLGLDGVPRVLDFGVAKAALRVHWSTQTGQVKGKLGYMSPEQLTTGQVDRRADIYSAGVILWEGLTGRRLFDPKTAPDVGVIVARILGGEIDPPSKIVPTTPKVLDGIVLKALSRSPGDRYATAREMAVALERAQAPLPSRQVGEWVAQVAGAGLQKRAAELTQIEGVELPKATHVSEYPSFHPPQRTEAEESGSVSVPGLPATDDPPPLPPPRRALASGQDLGKLMPTPPPFQPGLEVDMASEPPTAASEAETNPPPARSVATKETTASPPAGAKSSPEPEPQASPPPAPEPASPSAHAKPSPPAEAKSSPTLGAKPRPQPPPMVKRPAAPPRPGAAAKPAGPEAPAAPAPPKTLPRPPFPEEAPTVPRTPNPELLAAEKPKGVISGVATVIGFAPLSGEAAASAKQDGTDATAPKSIFEGGSGEVETKPPAEAKEAKIDVPPPVALQDSPPKEPSALETEKPAAKEVLPGQANGPVTSDGFTVGALAPTFPPPSMSTASAPSIPPEADALPMAPRRLVWAAAAACVVLALGTAWVMASRVRGGTPSADPAPTTTTTAAGTTTSAPATSVAPPPTETASASASAAEAPTPPVDTAQAAPPASTAPTAVVTPTTEPMSSAAAIPTATSHPHPTTRAPPKPNCNPPFTVDSQGVKIPKRECFH